MNCFELLCQVLEEEYDQISGTEAERDEQVSAALKRLSDHYSRVSTNGPGDYKDRATRFAYIFCYTTSHANLVYQIISNSKHLKTLFDRPSVEVACVGGGPGSDYLGILKYLMVQEKKPKLWCNLFDCEAAWMESWADVDRKVEAEIQLSLRSFCFDVTKTSSWQPHTKYYRSDLFTFIYFLSEVVKYKAKATPYFTTLMQRAQPGAKFLFVDNNSSDHFGWFDELVKANGLTVLKEQRGTLQMPGDEQKDALGRFFGKFKKLGGRGHWSPKLNADVAYRIVEKPGGGK
jgi:hypothetical protein